jgi:hypothetical protein
MNLPAIYQISVSVVHAHGGHAGASDAPKKWFVAGRGGSVNINELLSRRSNRLNGLGGHRIRFWAL